MRQITRRHRRFADLELERQGVRLEPELAEISKLLDRKSRQLLTRVAKDLRAGLTKSATGRDGMSAEQVLRSLVLKQIKNWSFRELRARIADGITLRQFTRFGAAAVPTHKAFHRARTGLTADTLAQINALVVELAIALGVEDARRVRMDTTVSETDITSRPTRGCSGTRCECSPATPPAFWRRFRSCPSGCATARARRAGACRRSIA